MNSLISSLQQSRGIRVKGLNGNLDQALSLMHRKMTSSGIERMIKQEKIHHIINSEKRVLARKALYLKLQSQDLARKLKSILMKKVRIGEFHVDDGKLKVRYPFYAHLCDTCNWNFVSDLVSDLYLEDHRGSSFKSRMHFCKIMENGAPVPNDLSLGGKDKHTPHTLLLTGPNMGGKSTLLRVACLVVIMAQILEHVI